MASYKAPLKEFEFLLSVLHAEQLSKLPGMEDATPDTMLGLADEAARLLEEQLAPTHRISDEGCKFDNGKVTPPPGFPEFYKQYWEAGWVGISQKEEFGGAGLPYTLGKMIEEMTCSANVSFALYPGLTTGCFEAIEANGNEEQKAKYLPKLATGEWTGTMAMTEPGAGSDVGAVTTKAYPQEDGSYLIEGGKIFISSGEHDMADNIIHFVLARLPDSPPGVKGLSTFVVPKYMVNDDGSLGERNKLRAVNIEHKMGLHGSCTCTMAFENAKGWMVGQPNQGIQNMFVMMNLARIMVGFQGLGQCELATQNAIRYAQERKQGKTFGGDATIIGHPDVRRMLFKMKSFTEGARMMAYETAMYVDISRHHPDEEVRNEAIDWVDLNTPLVKAFCTDAAFELGSEVIQVYGGHGFIAEHGVEQIARDSKILCLYEGTNGIQAMDLVRRKLMLHNGRLPQRFFDKVRSENLGEVPLGFIAKPLMNALDKLEETTKWIQNSFKSNPNDAAFSCTDYLRAFSYVYLGYNWLRMAKAAHDHSDEALRTSKLATAEFFAQRYLSQVEGLCDNVSQNSENLMALDAANF